MRLLRVPGGSFWMGSAPDESGRTNVEVNRQRVTVGDFYIGTTEVTQAQWERVMGRRPPPQNWRGADLPVHDISRDEALAFCRRLTELDGNGRKYRLPTEAEWEYACRAGTSTPFFFGTAHVGYVAWSRENSGARAQPVGQKWPNAWGLFDMHGNAAEWCADEVRTHPGATSGPASRAVSHVARGGSAALPSDACRAASRRLILPFGQPSDIGFRVVLDAAP